MQQFTTLAAFKKLLKVGTKLHAIHHLMPTHTRDEQGKPIYTEKDMGEREVKRIQSNAITLLTTKANGEIVESWLHYPKASECEVIEDKLIIYETNREGEKYKILTYSIV